VKLITDFKARPVRLEEFLHSMAFWMQMSLYPKAQMLDMFWQDVLEIVRKTNHGYNRLLFLN
jgi:hypothetical protein